MAYQQELMKLKDNGYWNQIKDISLVKNNTCETVKEMFNSPTSKLFECVHKFLHENTILVMVS